MKIHRRILHDYPLPIARVYERAVNAEEGKDLHDRSLLLFEILVHWAGILGLAASRPNPARLHRQKLERPSRGTWVELLRDLAASGTVYGSSLAGFLEGPIAGPEIDRLLEAVSRTLGDRAARRAGASAARLIDLLVSYRNRTVGHGASLEPGAYAELGTPLFEGIGALLEAAGFLVEFPLFYCEEARHRPDGAVSASIVRLMGIAPIREPSMPLPAGLGPGSLFAVPERGASGGFPVSPLAVFRDRALYLYNGLGRDRVPRYLCFDDNSQIAGGSAEDILAGLREGRPDAAPAASPPAIELQAKPERVRAGETFLLRVQIRFPVPAGRRVSLEARISPEDAGLRLGPGHAWSGGDGQELQFSFPYLALRPGPLRLEVEVAAGEEVRRRDLEVQAHPGAALPFAGRRQETDSIRRWLDSEGCGLLVLRGESGAGKSRLAGRVVEEMARRGAAAVSGKCRRSFRFPLQPFRDILLALLHQEEPEADRPAALDSIAALLWERFPDEAYIADYFKAFLARKSISSEQRAMVPYYWFQLLVAAAGDGPILAIIDDLQWADAETVQLITEILGLAHQRRAALKVLAIVQPFGLRAEEETALSRLEARTRDLEADRIRVETLALRPLDGEELEALVDGCFPGNSFRRELPWFYDELRRKTGGNPLFAEWVLKRLRSGAESGAPELLGGEPAWTPLPALTRDWFEHFVPREIESVLEQRLDALGAEIREAVRTAAAIGDPFDLRILERLLGGVEALDAVLPRLEEQELAAPAENPAFYRFAHSLIPHKIYRDFSSQSRWKLTRLHERIAGAMAEVYGDGELNQHHLSYAHHLVLGNRLQEGFKHLLLGAGRLLEQQLYASAVTHLEAAAKLLDGGVQAEEADRALLLLKLGETYRVLGRSDEAAGKLAEARRLTPAASGSRAAVELALGSIHVQRGELDAAEEIFRAALESAAGDPLQEAGAVSGLAAVHRIRGRLKEALAGHLHALELRERAGAETEVAVSCVNAGNLYFDLGQDGEAERSFRRSLPIFERRGLKNYLIYALSGLGNVLSRSDRGQARSFYEKAMRSCRETGNRAQTGVLHYNLAEVALGEHRYGEALAEVERALAAMEAAGRRAGEAGARCLKAELHRILGERDAAAAEIERALRVARSTGSRLDIAAALIEESSLAWTGGESARARARIDEALRHLEEGASAASRLTAAALLLRLGDRPRASAEIERAAAELSAESASETRCLLEHLRGLAVEDPGRGAAHLEAALGMAGDSYPELPWLLSELAVRSQPERARDLHGRAVRVLLDGAAGIDDPEARKRYLDGDPGHREVLDRARESGVDPDSPRG